VFDRYVGDPIPDGHHSLALRLTYRASNRTLTDAQVAAVREKAVAAVVDRYGATLRG
jgi:phenylalanyl-tRNA synthetase beta chain